MTTALAPATARTHATPPSVTAAATAALPVPPLGTPLDEVVTVAGPARRALPAVRARRARSTSPHARPLRCAVCCRWPPGRRRCRYARRPPHPDGERPDQRDDAAGRGPQPRPTRRLPARARRRPRPEHRADRRPTRAPDQHVVGGDLDVPHRGRRSTRTGLGTLLLLPARRSAGRDHPVVDQRGAATCSARRPGRRCSSCGSAPRSTRATSAAASATSARPGLCCRATAERPSMVFDADLMHGTDPAADAALRALAEATCAHATRASCWRPATS